VIEVVEVAEEILFESGRMETRLVAFFGSHR
jgi:hypothetical protein